MILSDVPLVINGWTIFAHPLFLDQVERVTQQVEKLKKKDPKGYKKKNATTLTAICDDNKLPLGITYMDTNLSKTKTGKHTIKHDINGVQKTLDNIPFNLKKYITVKLIGDKGYVSSKNFNVFNRQVKMIYPKKKNQKTKNTKKEKKILYKRHKIENFFTQFKKYNRIVVRNERKIVHYMSFVYIGLLDYLAKNLSKIKEI